MQLVLNSHKNMINFDEENIEFLTLWLEIAESVQKITKENSEKKNMGKNREGQLKATGWKKKKLNIVKQNKP